MADGAQVFTQAHLKGTEHATAVLTINSTTRRVANTNSDGDM
jgi:hypothetical protein